MRVGIFIGKMQDPKSGGGSTFQSSIIKQLIKTNSNHEFYIFYQGKANFFQDNDNVKFISIDQGKKKPLFGKSKYKKDLLNKAVLQNKIELVWFATPSYHFVEAPFVITVWDLEHRLQSYFPEVTLSGETFEQREKLYQTAIPKASYVIIGNKEGARQVHQFYNFPLDRIKTIALPTPQFTKDLQEDEEILTSNFLSKNNYLFYPAQFWPHKNHIRILKSLKILKEQGVNLKVAFTGSDKGNKNYITQKVHEFGLENDVKFLGFVSQSQLITLYKNALAMTFASACGPDNLPPLEAMALGCPVICADTPGMEEQLGENCALFFNRWDEKDLAQKIREILLNQSLRTDLINAGINLAEKLSPENYMKKFLELVDEFAPIRECWSGDQKYIHL